MARRKNVAEAAAGVQISGHYALIRPHGGAGASTLATLLDPAGTGAVIELPPGQRLQGRYPVIVARSTASCVEAAAAMLARWPPAMDRPALVVVADAPLPTPRVVRFQLESLSGLVSIVADMPYLYGLRELADPAQLMAIPRVAAAVARLRLALETAAGGRASAPVNGAVAGSDQEGRTA
jgi:hypothetical protein